MSAVSKMYKEQHQADIAHHKARVEWLNSEQPRWSCGTPVLPSDRAMLLK